MHLASEVPFPSPSQGQIIVKPGGRQGGQAQVFAGLDPVVVGAHKHGQSDRPAGRTPSLSGV